MKVMLAIAALACSLHAYSQNCSGYYFLQANKTIEMAIYNKKGDVTATQKPPHRNTWFPTFPTRGMSQLQM
jgi:hypothetical protein